MSYQYLRLAGLIIALLCPFSVSAEIYQENFQDGVADGWEPQQPEQWVINGRPKRNLNYRASDGDNDSVMISTYAGAEYEDVDFRVSLRADDNYAAYVVVRGSADFYRKSGINEGSGYAFGISAACGTGLPLAYNVYKLTDGVYQNIQPWVATDKLKCALRGNRIRIVAVGRLLKFFVNNKLVFKYRDAKPLAAGRVGLVGYTAPPLPTRHYFDNVFIRDLAKD
jgi:hypothetical protein